MDEKKISVKYVTSRPNFTKAWTLLWFKEWMPWVDEDQICIGDRSSDLQHDFKFQKMKDIGYGIIFEDSGEHVDHMLEVMPNALIVMVNQPWNEGYCPSKPSIVKPPRLAVGQPKVLGSYLALAAVISSCRL